LPRGTLQNALSLFAPVTSLWTIYPFPHRNPGNPN
jgi:hypothetical protein